MYIYRVRQKSPPFPFYLKHMPRFLKTAKNMFNQFEQDFFCLKIFLTGGMEPLTRVTLKSYMTRGVL